MPLFRVHHRSHVDGAPVIPYYCDGLIHGTGPNLPLIPEQMPNVRANLWLANMDFEEFADSVDWDGVFRGFLEA